MSYDEQQANRIREAIMNAGEVTEQTMFGGLCFMVDEKLCICVRDANLLCRVGPGEFENALEKPGASTMQMGKRTMQGYVYVDADSVRNPKDLEYWINASLAFNKIARAAKKLKSRS